MAMAGRILSAVKDIIQAMAAHGAHIHELLTQINESLARVQFESKNADRAQAQAALESTLQAASTQTSFKIYRRYHDYDLWRAKAVLEDARRFSVAARRA